MKQKKRTLQDELAYWRSVQLSAKLSVDEYERRVREIDQEIAKLRVKRDALEKDREAAPLLAIRAAGEIRKVERQIMQAKLVGGGATSSRKLIERKTAQREKRIAKLKKIASELKALKASGVDMALVERLMQPQQSEGGAQ